ncbi:MAG: hypothetical protein SPE98_04240, partial [Bacteroidaceae bacterium]|nr:hypothetical protein [Bacteroidaceae bacterium]
SSCQHSKKSKNSHPALPQVDGQEVQQMMEVDTPTWVFTSLLFPLCLRSDDSRDGVGRNFGSEEKA